MEQLPTLRLWGARPGSSQMRPEGRSFTSAKSPEPIGIAAHP